MTHHYTFDLTFIGTSHHFFDHFSLKTFINVVFEYIVSLFLKNTHLLQMPEPHCIRTTSSHMVVCHLEIEDFPYQRPFLLLLISVPVLRFLTAEPS